MPTPICLQKIEWSHLLLVNSYFITASLNLPNQALIIFPSNSQHSKQGEEIPDLFPSLSFSFIIFNLNIPLMNDEPWKMIEGYGVMEKVKGKVECFSRQ